MTHCSGRSHGYAFRGSSDKLFAQNNGNFLKFIETISLFDSVIKKHLQRITSKEIHNHYLGKTIQNKIIDLLRSKIEQTIISMLKSAKYFSIMLDCTPDQS